MLPDSSTEKDQKLSRQLGGWSAFAIFIGYFLTQYLSFHAVMFVVGVIIGFTGSDQNPEDIERLYRFASMLAIFICFILAGIVLVLMTRYFAGGLIMEPPPKGIGWSLGGSPYFITGIVLGGILGWGFVAIGWYVFPPKADLPKSIFSQMAYTSEMTWFIWAFLVAVLIPPLEEFLYRGVLYTGLSRSSNPILAGFIVTVLFVFGHLPHAIHYLPGIVTIMLLGVLSLTLRILARSVGPAVALHSTYNLCIVAGGAFFSPMP